MTIPLRRLWPVLLVLLVGCGFGKRLQALREVEFRLDRIESVRLAGMDLSRLRSLDDLGPEQMATIAAGALLGEVPLDLDLIVAARNPSINSSTAELYSMDWTLLIADRDTVTGRFDRRTQIAPGRLVELPVRAHLNLVKFFGRDGRELLDVLKGAIGEHGTPLSIGLRANPLIGTPFGPMRYPGSVTIVRRVGESYF